MRETMPQTSPHNLREQFAEKLWRARCRTLELFDLADEAVLQHSPGFGFRPIIWHLAHIGAFEEYWILQQANHETALNQRFQIIFDPIKTPRENSTELPTKAEMLGYLRTVRDNALRVLDNFDFDSNNPLFRRGYVFDLVHQHELQHQETLAYLFHLLPLEKIRNPLEKVSGSKFQVQSSDKTASRSSQSEIEFPATDFTFGATNNEFAYDNELPAHNRFVPAFKLDRFLTTNFDFAEFIAEKGYERAEFWSAAGWRFAEKERLRAPLYWSKTNNGDWRIRRLFDEQSLAEAADFPVYGISFFEAEAYAKFRGKRLPSEFERERAATSDHDGNLDFKFWHTTPVNHFAAHDAAADLNGNLWEFTSSDFAAYPNFRAFPYEDYSEKWFDGDHKVLRGNSFATSPEISRATFRNFFRQNFRIAFAGIRLAQNV